MCKNTSLFNAYYCKYIKNKFKIEDYIRETNLQRIKLSWKYRIL